MDYYVSKKAGSIMFRRPRKHHLIAGDHIPAEVWEAVEASTQAELLKTGMVEGFEDPDSVQLSEPEQEQLPRVGVGNDDFMPEAKVQRGERRDAELERLIAEQEARKAESEVDPERGGSADGVVKVELPPEEDDEDLDDEDLDADESDLTDEERAAIEEMEREDQEGS